MPFVVLSISRDSEVRNLIFVVPGFVRPSPDLPPYFLPRFGVSPFSCASFVLQSYFATAGRAPAVAVPGSPRHPMLRPRLVLARTYLVLRGVLPAALQAVASTWITVWFCRFFFWSRNQARGKCVRFTLVSPLAVEATTSHSNLCNHILLIWAHQDARGHVLRVWRACCMLRIVSRFCVALCLSPALL